MEYEKSEVTEEKPDQELDAKNGTKVEDSQQPNEIEDLPSEEKNSLSDSIVNIQPYETDLKHDDDPIQEDSESEKTNIIESTTNVDNTLSNNSNEIDQVQAMSEDQSGSQNESNDENVSDLTDSIVKINSIPHESDIRTEKFEPEQINTESSNEKLTESMVNVDNNLEPESNPTENLDSNMIESIIDEIQNENIHDHVKESTVEVDSIKENQTTAENNQTENVIQSSQKEDDITKSTLLLTESQILTEPCAEVEKINEQGEKNLNTESMIVTNLSSEASSFVTSPIINDYVEENKLKSVDDENLDKEYEITESIKDEVNILSQEISSKLNEVRKNTQEDLKEALEKESERIIENEKYEKILGNDSLLKKILKYGDASIGRPSSGQMVTVSYEAYLKDNREKLVDHCDNLQFILGDGDVISAMDMVVSLMDKYELCEMITEARLAFGDLGKQDDIPPKADLVYKIELKDFRNMDELNQMNPVERLSLAEAKKLRGNYYFNRQDFYQAINSYKKGLKYFDEVNLRGDESGEDSEKFVELSQALLMNTVLAYFKLSELRQALDNLEKVLMAQPNHIKGLYIRGKILLQLGETEEAIKCLNKAVQLDPNNTDIKKELLKAQTKHKIQYESEKKMYQKMMSGVTKTDEKKSKTPSKSLTNYTGFIAAGLAVAAASIGVALFARYKNIV